MTHGLFVVCAPVTIILIKYRMTDQILEVAEQNKKWLNNG
jgi:hypothetical protein